MDHRFPQAPAPDALYNAYYAAQHNAAINARQELSVNAQEFIPKFSPAPPGDWSGHPNHPEASQVYQQQQQPQQQVFSQHTNSRIFPSQPQHPISFAQQSNQQQRHHYMYQQPQQQQQQQNRNFGQNNRVAAGLIQNQHQNHHHHQNYSNQAPAAPHYLMMNQQQQPNLMGGGGNNFQQQQHQPRGGGIQNRLHFNAQPEPLPAEPVPHKQTETEQVALDYLGEVVSKLNDNPGMFENFQKRLHEMFSELANNHFVMSNAIETIFEHSINEQNFRYTGARLCLLLDNLDLSSSSTFRNLLVMKMEFQHTELASYMQNDQRRVRGTTLFLAELFVQLKRPEQDSRSAVDVSRFVLNSIILLLTKPGPENIKCVCQTLKLSGYDLQKENPTEVEDAINSLRLISEEQNIQTKRLILSVIDLFSDNWGRRDVELENQAPPMMPDHLQTNYNDSPVFYGPDGQIITEEESLFLNANMPANYPINIDDIIDDESDDLVDDEDEPEMDLEIQMAYKEFMAGNKLAPQNDARKD
uniref:Ionotropic receptor 2 n=1 Tax=Propsilocerus akamusi TaxID=903466 RepID=A0A7D0PAK9_9DIPT|nr:ionotropic receptor 2 [Propsilocerus akamusi]